MDIKPLSYSQTSFGRNLMRLPKSSLKTIRNIICSTALVSTLTSCTTNELKQHEMGVLTVSALIAMGVTGLHYVNKENSNHKTDK